MSKKNGILIFIAVLIFISPAIAVIWLYSVNLGGISKEPNDWAAFGSLLSGVFTYIAASGTMGTLIFLIYQQSRNNKILDRQIILQNFEEYEKHKKLFFDNLEEIKNHYNGDIRFPQRDRVYSSIFYMNSPSSMQYKLSIDEEGSKPKDLCDCLNKYRKIENLLNNYNAFNNCINVIIEMIDLSYDLGITAASERENGQVLWFGEPTHLNINSLRVSLGQIERTLNMILAMSGNNAVNSITHKIEPSVFKDCVLGLLDQKKGRFPVTISGYESRFS